MEVALVVLYLGVVTTALYGGVVPDYRDDAGIRIADRTLAAAAGQVEAAVPPATAHVERRVRVDIPRTIRGTGYWIHAREGGTVALDHPRDGLDSAIRVSLPASVLAVSGAWSSDEPALVVVTGSSDGVTVRLVRG